MAEESYTDYRVVGERRRLGAIEPASAACGPSLSRAEARAEEMRRGSLMIAPYRNVRIEQRTVTKTDWQPLKEGCDED